MDGTIISRLVGPTGTLVNALQNAYYVDKSGDDTNGNGSIAKPYLTLGKVFTAIGTSSGSSDFDDPTKCYYAVRVGAGVYTENVTVGTRPFILLDLSAAKIVGNVTVQFNQGAAGVTLQQAKLIIFGSDLRSTYNSASIPWTGVNGNINLTSITSGSSLTYQLHVINSGCTGNIAQSLGSGGGAFTAQVFLENAIVAGSITQTGASNQVVLYAANVDTSASQAIGGVNGNVQLNILRNVRFDGAVVTSGGGARWFDVEFKAATAHDFTSSSATVVADANSIASFNANVPTKGSIAFTYADTGFGVGYTPTTPGNWSPVPTTSGGALDTLAAAFIAAGSGTVTSVGLLTDSSTSSIIANTANAVTGSPVTTAGSFTLTLKTQNANIVLAGPSSGGAAAPTFRALVGADLPNPSASTLGGIQSKAAVSHQFLTSISTSGVPALAQPAFSDVSGTADLTTQVTGILPVANGGTNSSTALNSNRFAVTSGGKIVEASAVTASRVVVSDANGLPTACNITTTQINASLGFELDGHIESPSNKIYFIVFKAAFGFTINTLDIATVSGTCTVAVKIAGTNVTSISAVSVSSTPTTATASGANTVTAGQQVTMVVSSNSSSVDMAWTLAYTKT